MTSRPDIIPVILAGGAGTRLRPLTGPKQPKPFLRLFSEHSLFQDTALRGAVFRQPVVVCQHDHGHMALQHLEEIGITPDTIILEPEIRNTAAAIAAAAFHLQGRDAVMLVMPSDHYLPDVTAFQRAAMRGAASAAAGTIMMLGVKPQRPDTRFGYIKARGAGYISVVEQFIEKPGKKAAQALLDEGRSCWNTGIFMARPLTFLTELARQSPEIYSAVDVAVQAGGRAGVFFMPKRESFARSPSTSVDYAVLEGCKQAGLVMLNAAWDDVGHWPSLLKLKLQGRRNLRAENG